MAIPQVVYSPRARTDLFDIESYIATNDGRERAGLIIGRLKETIGNLAYMPGMGSPRPYINNPAIRAFSSSPWTIFYKPLPELEGILVVRVLDGRRDLPELFSRSR